MRNPQCRLSDRKSRGRGRRNARICSPYRKRADPCPDQRGTRGSIVPDRHPRRSHRRVSKRCRNDLSGRRSENDRRRSRHPSYERRFPVHERKIGSRRYRRAGRPLKKQNIHSIPSASRRTDPLFLFSHSPAQAKKPQCTYTVKKEVTLFIRGGYHYF